MRDDFAKTLDLWFFAVKTRDEGLCGGKGAPLDHRSFCPVFWTCLIRRKLFEVLPVYQVNNRSK
jgi:hypothetical protein